MSFWNPDQPGMTQYIDYRPSRCRCGSVVQPHDVICQRCKRKQSLLFTGLDRIYEDDLDKVIENLEKQAREKPDDYMRLHHLAGAHLLLGNYTKARAYYRRVTQLNPQFPDAHLNLGGVLAYLNEKDEAVSELKEFIRLDLHSPLVERVLRTISSIKNIPIENTRKETGVKQKEPNSADRTRIMPAGRSRLSRSYPPPPLPTVIKRKRAWGVIDLFFLFIILIAIAAWYIFPSQSRDLLNSAITTIENRFQFSVANGELSIASIETEDPTDSNPEESANPDDEDPSTSEDGDQASSDEDAPEPILNLNPENTSYFPLAVGNRWELVTYKTRDPDGGTRQNEGIREIVVVSLADSSQGIYKVEDWGTTIHLMEAASGVYSIRWNGRRWDNRVVQIPYPPDVGASRSVEGQTITIIGEEIVPTQAGLFKCIKIRITNTALRGLEWFAWYGQGVGLVKYMKHSSTGFYEIGELRSVELN